MAMRCMHEASLSLHNCFLTLTYNDDQLPQRGQLHYEHIQKAFKRLRHAVGPFRHYTCGEYGDDSKRPHYHSLLFGVDFHEDRRPISRLSEHQVWRSPTLEKIWTFGNSSIGSLTFESAAYVARYCMKKVTGKGAADHYWRIDETGAEYSMVPEFAYGSNRPGIGARWLEKYMSQTYPRDYVVINGKEVKPPRYYDKLFEEQNPQSMEWVKFLRFVKAEQSASDNTQERLTVKETVAKARVNQFKRLEQ